MSQTTKTKTTTTKETTRKTILALKLFSDCLDFLNIFAIIRTLLQDLCSPVLLQIERPENALPDAGDDPGGT